MWDLRQVRVCTGFLAVAIAFEVHEGYTCVLLAVSGMERADG